MVQESREWVGLASQGWSLSTHSMRQGIKFADAAWCLHDESALWGIPLRTTHITAPPAAQHAHASDQSSEPPEKYYSEEVVGSMTQRDNHN